MTTRWRAALRGASALFVLLAIRCGGQVATGPLESEKRPGRLPEPTPSDEAIALASAQCDFLERCDPGAMFLFSDASRGACEDYFTCASRGRTTTLEAQWQLSACIESLQTRECPDALQQPITRFSYDRSFPWGPDCGETTLGERLGPPPDAPSVGEACIRMGVEYSVCARGSYCAASTRRVAGRHYCGTCERKFDVGAACQLGDQCIEGARCLSGQCQWIRQIGESCQFNGECAISNCVASVCAPSRLMATPYADVVGRECEDVLECGNQAALYCGDGICRPLPDEGEPCAYMMPMGHGACRLGQECIDGRCLSLGCSIDVGEPCSGFCTAGAVCDDGVCVPRPGAGEPCVTWCVPDGSDRCWPLCASGLQCVEGLCDVHEVRENGGSCDFDRDCVSGFCERDFFEACSDTSLRCPPPCGECGVCTAPPTAALCE